MPARDLALLTEAAREAGAIAAEFWGKAPKVWEKPGAGPVSEADFAIDAALRARLGGARPDYGWLSEETEDTPARLGARRIFIVDPLDGTRAFLKGERSFAHALAVAEGGQVVAAVVYLPMRDKLYAATLGGGAFLNGAPIAAAAPRALDEATVLAGRPALAQAHWKGPAPRFRPVLRPSLAYRLCLVAEGRFDALLTLRASWDWDTAAGGLIAAEAGATLSDRRGRPLAFNTPVPQSEGVIAAPALLHAEMVARLA